MAKILIVEDEIPQQEALTNKLKTAGMEVFTAADGAEGLTQALALKPDLIILDLLMPRMTGTAMLAKLRQSGDWGKLVPVIVLTNLDPDENILKNIVVTEPVFYLLKADTSLDEVLAKVNSVLERSLTPPATA
jgi:two-component system response regulator Irr